MSYKKLVLKELNIGVKLLDVDSSTVTLARKISKQIDYISARPSRVACGCIYLASIINFNPISQKEASIAFGCSIYTLRKIFQNIYVTYYKKLTKI